MSNTTKTASPTTGLPGSLASGLADRPTALLFPGIDPAWQAVLSEALLGRPELTAWLEQVAAELDEWAATPAVRALGQFPDGFSPLLLADRSAPGVADPGADPDERALAAPFLLVGNLLANLAQTSGLALEGLSVGGLSRGSAAGHSAGLMAAWLISTAAGPDGIVPVAPVVAAAQLMALMGAHAAGHRWTVSGDQALAAARGEAGAATPMVAVSGPRLAALDAALAAARTSDDVVVAVANGPRHHVLSGDPAALAQLRARLEAVSMAQAAARSKGRHGGEVLQLAWEPLASPVAFHHPELEAAARDALAQAEALGIVLPGDAGPTIDLAATPPASLPRIPVVDPATASAITGPGATGQVVRSILARPHDWVAALREVTALGAREMAADGTLGATGDAIRAAACDGARGVTGNGAVAVVVSRLGSLGGTTAAALRGCGVTVVDPSTPDGRTQLFTPGSAPTQPVDYERYRPRVVRLADGSVTLVNRHTAATGRSPMVLAGMTPSTVGVPIVAAAANAGHVAELAGGGQVSERILTLRMAELREALDPGQEVVFNALYLDPYLWDLHLGKDRLVQKARAVGAPINGVTVSAGIPPLEEALALLDELNEAGIWLNAFKPGTVGGVREVLAIAEQTPHRVWLHLEGGAAGGHHSWEDLEDLLLATYHLIREHDNVLLAVGGGIGQPSRAAELLTGDWALAHGEAPMPVDAILLGTVAMATRESGASGSVKAALVAAEGHDSWVLRGEVAGGATSGRSGLDADIHFLENSAAAAARLLDEVAGDAKGVAARRDEIVEALSRTAKPYFGDLAEMTYEQVLRRFVELTALGRHRRYDDGAWLDVTHRARFVALLQLAEARLDVRDTGEVPTLFADPASVDDPAAAVEALLGAHPVARTALMHPVDVAAFRTIARMPGKPVPFVPVLDADVRRWYQADALWQAHDDRYDADQVLIIPGPRAVGGIEVVDEPVAGLLDRFETEVAARLGAGVAPSGAAAGPDFRLGVEDGSTSAEPVLSAALASPTWLWLGASRANPLRRIAPADQWQLEGRRATWSAEQAGGPSGESALLEVAEVGGLRLSIRWPSLGRAGDGELVVPVEVTSQAGVVTFTVTAEGLSAAGASLLAMFARPVGNPAGGRAHAATVGAHAELPDAVMAQLWPAIFTRLAEAGLADGVLDLVHATHEVTRSAVPADPTGPAVDRPTITRTDRGHLVTVRSTANGVVVRDRFFVRRALVDRSLALETVAERAQGHIATPRRTLGRLTLTAPRHLESFAMVSGDPNPIHRSDALARMVGLPGRIVHGMWTSAAATRAVIERAADGRSERLRRWSVDFVAPVRPGEQVEITVTRVGLRDGARVVEVEVTAAAGLVARGVAEVAPPRTVHVFPGQGIQGQGMGMDAYATSPAARGVWDEADRITRERLGFSILDVVRRNPSSVQADGGVYRHPAGVLHLTQFTQVAMATLASAQVAQLKEAGAFDPSAVVAGHSVGEYNALAASSTVLSLPALIELVFARGQSMHGLVPRDEQGQSDYRLGVIRPHLAGLSHGRAEEVVAEVAQETGQLCEIVNHNLRGKQYAVAGTVTALETLAQRLGEGTPGRAPLVYVPGIDVPFHSSALTPGVDRFREHLRAKLPERVDPAELVGRYIPNLYPHLFSLDRDFVSGVQRSCGSPVLAGVLADWDAASADPGTLARTLLVELLAWQFASPVRWIDTFELLTAKDGPAVERLVEIGVGSAPTLANLAKGSLALPTHEGTRPVVLNLELDDEAVFQTDADPVAADSTAPTAEVAAAAAPQPVDAPVAAAPVPAAPVAAAPGADTTADAPVDHATALAALLCLRVGVRPEQLGADTVDVLVDGASSRRNQVLMDLGKEFSVPAIDGAHEAPLPDLVSNLAGRSAGYRYPGPVLAAAVESGLTSALGPRGGTPASVAKRVGRHWGLGAGWVDRTSLELALGTREGTSKRGGPLGGLAGGELAGATADELIDAAVRAAGSRAGVNVAPLATTTAGGTVDAAAVTALRDHVEGVMAEQATDLLAKLGRDARQPYDEAAGAAQRELAERLALLESEHGAAKQVATTFDPARHVVLASADTWVRNDVEQLVQSSIEAEVAGVPFTSPEALDQIAVHRDAEPRIAEALRFHRERLAYSHPRTAGLLDHALALEPRGLPVGAGTALPEVAELSARPGQLAGHVALVTGASPGSIAHAALAHLLRGGATTVVVTTNDDEARIAGYRDLERRCAAPGASLHVVRANLASFADIDAVLDWLTTPTVEQLGAASRQVKPALWPTLVLPFAAAPAGGELPDAREDAQAALRLLLLGVQRLVGGLAQRVAAADRDPFTVVLPLSPNHGTFGGDGAYGEAKAALETMFARWHSEAATWGRSTRLIGAEIGWVRGTGLMAGNDRLAEAVERRLGITTWSAEQMGAMIAALALPTYTARAAAEPVRLDLSGGLSGRRDVGPALRAAAAEAARAGTLDPIRHAATQDDATQNDASPSTVTALPNLPDALLTGGRRSRPAVTTTAPRVSADEMVVIVGIAEMGPHGGSTTRWQAESGGLQAAGVVELAWRTGLIEWDEGSGRWRDAASKETVAESAVADRYRDEVRRRTGIRPLSVTDGVAADGYEQFTEVFLDRPLTRTVASLGEARALASGTEGATVHESDGTWRVTFPAGAAIRIPTRRTLSRSVGGQFPDGVDPVRHGLDGGAAGSMDPLAAWNLVVTAEALADAGVTAEELVAAVHPSLVGNTQGSGMGGMSSIRTMYMAPTTGRQHANDVLQEALGNVVPAHTNQGLIGGYGPMVHPVAACATAAVSLEEAVDKIRLGKAHIVVAGGWDDLSTEGINGFADMVATADNEAMIAAGLAPHQHSRPGDRRRRGFVEAQGGGSFLVVRGSVALALGLPVRAVVAYAASFGDGINTSIPAPGLGALGAARGGTDSPLARGLADLGLGADDVAVVSKHDTSTQANDPNEAFIHATIQRELGRTPGAALRVISQKALTGHSKGGAAAWQIAGLCDVFETGIVPGNPNLVSVDPAVTPGDVLVDHRPLRRHEPVRAALLTSLGFGHVSAVVALAHPDVFLAGLSDDQRSDYLARADRRRVVAARRRLASIHGGEPLLTRRTERPLTGAAEAEMLLGRSSPEPGRAGRVS